MYAVVRHPYERLVSSYLDFGQPTIDDDDDDVRYGDDHRDHDDHCDHDDDNDDEDNGLRGDDWGSQWWNCRRNLFSVPH